MLSSVFLGQKPVRHSVVGQGATGREAIELCLRLRPDMLLLDLMLPDFNGVEVLTQLRGQLTDLKVVFFSGCVQKPLIAQVVALGADGYVLKTQPLKSLLDAVEPRLRRRQVFRPVAIMRLNNTPSGQSCRAGKRSPAGSSEVARLIAEGNTTKEAASSRLGISVEDPGQAPFINMMRKLKLGVHDAVSVTRYVMQSAQG